VIIPIANVLTAEQLAQVRDLLAQGTYVDGKQTAGWHARLVKNNEQLSGGEPAQRANEIIHSALLRNDVFQAAARPKRLRPMLFSRYSDGQNYGAHVDDALMGRGGEMTRSDISITVFLSDADSYEGGELVMEGTGGDQSFKLDAGGAIAYPSNTLHYVAPVTSGTREVAVSWAESLVRDPAKREMLFDLDTSRRGLFQREGKSREFDLISKTHANLLRMWAET
jgi:PKHD-type hydroxylase